jgi:hypothetical protein
MLEPTSKQPIAHLHSSRFPHDRIEIIGNRRGLECLINVLIDAVSLGDGRGEIQSCDGYDSEVHVTRLEGKRRPEEWMRSGSHYWDIDDPLVARIWDLTEENRRLRQVVQSLRRDRKSIRLIDDPGGSGATDEGLNSAG